MYLVLSFDRKSAQFVFIRLLMQSFVRMYFLTFTNYPQIISDKESGRVERDAGLGKIIYDLCIIVNVTISCDLMLKKTLHLILTQTHFLNNIDSDLNDCPINLDFFFI